MFKINDKNLFHLTLLACIHTGFAAAGFWIFDVVLTQKLLIYIAIGSAIYSILLFDASNDNNGKDPQTFISNTCIVLMSCATCVGIWKGWTTATGSGFADSIKIVRILVGLGWSVGGFAIGGLTIFTLKIVRQIMLVLARPASWFVWRVLPELMLRYTVSVLIKWQFRVFIEKLKERALLKNQQKTQAKAKKLKKKMAFFSAAANAECCAGLTQVNMGNVVGWEWEAPQPLNTFSFAVNPATGLPVVGFDFGMDVGGNSWGTNDAQQF